MPSGSYSALAFIDSSRPRSLLDHGAVSAGLLEESESPVVVLAGDAPAETGAGDDVCCVDSCVDGKARGGDGSSDLKLGGCGGDILLSLLQVGVELCRYHRSSPG